MNLEETANWVYHRQKKETEKLPKNHKVLEVLELNDDKQH